MAKKVFEISLKPVSAFFFGSERHFSSGVEGVNYLVRSNQLPQQSSLLGLLRFLALEKNELLFPLGKGKTIRQAKDLVGDASFRADGPKNQSFGCIQQISPLFLAGEGRLLWPRTYGYKNNQPIEITTKKLRAYYGEAQQTDSLPVLDATSKYYKDGFDAGWITVEQRQTLSAKDLFIPDQRDGIIKNRDIDDQDAYFKQTLLHLKKGYRFVFYAELDEKCAPNPGLVTLGGEKSTFRLTLKEAPLNNPISNWKDFSAAPYSDLALLPEAQGCFIIVSPTLLQEDYEQYLYYAIGSVQDFRNLHSPMDNETNFTDVARHGDKGKNINRAEHKYKLLAPGTVLYANDAKEMRKKLLAETHFHKIGYNYFVEQ